MAGDVLAFLNAMNFVAVASPESAVSVACVMKDPETNSVFLQSQVAILAMLVAVLLTTLVGWFVASRIYKNRLVASTAAGSRSASNGSEDGSEEATSGPSGMRQRSTSCEPGGIVTQYQSKLVNQPRFERAILTIIVRCHTVFAPLSQRMAANFACGAVKMKVYSGGEVVDEEKRYREQDPNLPCYGADTVALGVGMLLVVLIIPFGFMLGMRWERTLLQRLRKSQSSTVVQIQTKRFQRVYGYLTVNYTESNWWWEAVVMLRKALLTTLVVVTSPQGTELQLQVATLVFVALLLMQMHRQPYSRAHIQHLDVSSLFVLCLSFGAAQFYFNDDPLLHQRSVLVASASVLIIAANSMWMLWAVLLLVHGFLEEKHLKYHGLLGQAGKTHSLSANVAVMGDRLGDQSLAKPKPLRLTDRVFLKLHTIMLRLGIVAHEPFDRPPVQRADLLRLRSLSSFAGSTGSVCTVRVENPVMGHDSSLMAAGCYPPY